MEGIIKADRHTHEDAVESALSLSDDVLSRFALRPIAAPSVASRRRQSEQQPRDGQTVVVVERRWRRVFPDDSAKHGFTPRTCYDVTYQRHCLQNNNTRLMALVRKELPG